MIKSRTPFIRKPVEEPSRPKELQSPPPRSRSQKMDAPQTPGDSGVDMASPDQHYDAQEEEKSIAENTPEVRTDVVRETDKFDAEEMPEEGNALFSVSIWMSYELCY